MLTTQHIFVLKYSSLGYQFQTPSYGRLVRSTKAFLRLSKGIAHFAVRRPGYFHHFIVTDWFDKEKEVFEYSSWFIGVDPEVLRSSLSKDDIGTNIENGNLYFIEKPDYPKTIKEKEKAIQRLLARVGETAYGVSYNNCEHFVSYILTSNAYSEQIEIARPLKLFMGDIVQTLTTNAPFYVGKSVAELSASILYRSQKQIPSFTMYQESSKLLKREFFSLDTRMYTSSVIIDVVSFIKKAQHLQKLSRKQYITHSTNNFERGKCFCGFLTGFTSSVVVTYQGRQYPHIWNVLATSAGSTICGQIMHGFTQKGFLK